MIAHWPIVLFQDLDKVATGSRGTGHIRLRGPRNSVLFFERRGGGGKTFRKRRWFCSKSRGKPVKPT